MTSTASPTPAQHTAAGFDPILGDLRRYRDLYQAMSEPGVTDDEATLLHAEAIHPFAGDHPPVIRSREGAAEAIRFIIEFSDPNHVDANVLRGVLGFLDGEG